MNIATSTKLEITLAAVLALVLTARGDTFGTGGNQFTIDFVEIGNAGNADDSGAGGGFYSAPYGGVAYDYRMGTYEIPQDAITKATNLGMTNVTAGAWTGSRPAANMLWYEMASFVNWLNTSTGHHAAYDLTWQGSGWIMNLWSSAEAWQTGGENRYRHKDAYYFLPSEDEWYKAAFHKNDGVTANYWDYATASNNIPDGIDFSGDTVFDAVFYQGGYRYPPSAVNNVGLASSYGTYGQNGNVEEWIETAYDGSNNSASEGRTVPGGDWSTSENILRSSARGKTTFIDPIQSYEDRGFRVASVADLDTDGDGILDRFETGTGVYVSPNDTGTSPTNPDSDGDGLTDGQEVNTYHSNPTIKDTDGDGFDDGFEVATGFSPTSVASTPDAQSTILTAVEYRFNAALGISYRIESSTDLANWTTMETPIMGAGGVIIRFYSIESQPKRYFRSRRN